MALKTTTKVAIGIFAGLAVYLIYRMFQSYGQDSSGLNVTASNLSQPTTDKSQLETSNNVSPAVYIPPSVGPSTETRTGRGHF